MASSKQFRLVEKNVLFPATLAVLLIVIYFGRNNPYEHLIVNTRTELALLRHKVKVYNEQFGRYPENLSQLKQLHENGGDFHETEHKEYISNKEGCGQETDELNNCGGWYYNSDIGDVKVNLTDPLCSYFPKYFYPGRSDIPCEWVTSL